MSFEDAVPVSRISYGRDVGFDLGSRGGATYSQKGNGQNRKQKVNISEDTMLRVARAKLGRMVSTRTGYTQNGAIAFESSVGSLLSAKA